MQQLVALDILTLSRMLFLSTVVSPLLSTTSSLVLRIRIVRLTPSLPGRIIYCEFDIWEELEKWEARLQAEVDAWDVCDGAWDGVRDWVWEPEITCSVWSSSDWGAGRRDLPRRPWWSASVSIGQPRSSSANSGPSTGICYTLQQCYIDTVVTHSTHSSHSNVYLLYNTSIVL